MTVHTIGGLVKPSKAAMLIALDPDRLLEVHVQPSDMDDLIDADAISRGGWRAVNDDDIPRRATPTAHVLGERLDALSVEEIGHRVALLKTEIERLEAAKTAKLAALQAAGLIFTR